MAAKTPSASPVPKDILKALRHLHQSREPLNLSAVKRRHPKLVESIYQLRPFVGWRRALAAAGLTYQEINVELEEFVTCRICGADFKALTAHLGARHEVTPEEYQAEFPGAELTSEQVRASMTHSQPALLPHWEPLWTAEYALDRIAEYAAGGHPLNCNEVAKFDVPLLAIAMKKFGSWDDALRAAGIDPAQWRQWMPRIHYETQEAVVAEIRRRHAEGLPLFSSAVGKGEQSESSLLEAGHALFGSWDAALEAAGLNPLEIRRKINRFLDPQSIIDELRRRRHAGLPLNVGAIYDGPHKDAYLHMAAKKHFTSWEKALRAAGIDPAGVRQRTPTAKKAFPDLTALIDEIKRLAKTGIALDTESMRHSEHRPLVTWAVKLLNSWNKALILAGQEQHAVTVTGRRMYRYSNQDAVTREIARRAAVGLPLDCLAMARGEFRDGTLLNKARAFFGSWGNALRAAGVDLSSGRDTKSSLTQAR